MNLSSRSRSLLLLAGLSAVSGVAPAQDLSPAAAAAADCRSPIRTAADAGGTWTSGADYKASFHDGFAFYPVLGKTAPRSLPLRWTTEAVTAGGASLLGAAPATHEAADWRYAYVHGAVREVYDVRPEGVEQSFVLAQRPAAPGDLVIVGRIDSELRCAPAAPAHQALVFADGQGNAVVRYGEAFAIDAFGRRTNVTTTFDGTRVSLTVDGGWLAGARFPVTVDPLTSAVTLAQSPGRQIAACDIGHQGETATRNVFYVFDRWVSSTDRDVYGYLSDTDWSNRTLVLTSVSATYDDYDPAVAFAAGADRWIVSYIRGGAILRTHFHDRDNTTLNSSTTDDRTYPFYVLRHIDLGGTYSGSRGYHGICVYQVDPTDNRPPQVGALRINALARTTEVDFTLGATPYTSFERERPSVNQVAGSTVGNNDGWLIVYQERSAIAVDDWDLMAVRTDPQVTTLTTPLYVVDGGNRNVTVPQVSGVSGYYTLTYLASVDRSTSSGARLVGRRIVWAPGQTVYNGIGAENTIAVAVPPLAVLSNHGVAVNHEISTTALATYTVTRLVGLERTVSAYATRLTSSGAPVDTHTLFSSSGLSAIAPRVTFALPGQQYQVVYGTSEANAPVYGRRYTYPADAIEVLYGTGCGPMQIGGHRPYLGNGHYHVSGHSAPANVPATLMVGATAAAVPLDAIGMPGCMLNVNQAFALPGATGTTGLAVFPVPLPDVVVPYDLVFQIAYVNPGANARNVQATRGLRAQVR